MRLAVVLFFATGILAGFLYGLDSSGRPVRPIESLERPAQSLHIEIDAPPDGRLQDYLIFVAPTSEAISRAIPELSTAKRRAFVTHLALPGEHRILVTTMAGSPRVDQTVTIGVGVTRMRFLVPTSSRAPAEAGIAVYAVDPDKLPTRFDRVTGWIDHDGRTSRADLSVGTAQSDGSMLVPIGAYVNRVLTGASPGRLRLLVESAGLGARLIEVPKPKNPDAPRSSAAIASVVVPFNVPSLPKIVVTGENKLAVTGELAGRLRVVARALPLVGVASWEAMVSPSGRAELPPLAPGRYELRVLLDLVAPLDGAIELARQERDLVSYDPSVSIELPLLNDVTLVGSSLAALTEFTLHRTSGAEAPSDDSICSWVLAPDERFDLHGLPAGRYEVRWGAVRRTFELPGESEVGL